MLYDCTLIEKKKTKKNFKKKKKDLICCGNQTGTKMANNDQVSVP